MHISFSTGIVVETVPAPWPSTRGFDRRRMVLVDMNSETGLAPNEPVTNTAFNFPIDFVELKYLAVHIVSMYDFGVSMIMGII